MTLGGTTAGPEFELALLLLLLNGGFGLCGVLLAKPKVRGGLLARRSPSAEFVGLDDAADVDAGVEAGVAVPKENEALEEDEVVSAGNGTWTGAPNERPPMPVGAGGNVKPPVDGAATGVFFGCANTAAERDAEAIIELRYSTNESASRSPGTENLPSIVGKWRGRTTRAHKREETRCRRGEPF